MASSTISSQRRFRRRGKIKIGVEQTSGTRLLKFDLRSLRYARKTQQWRETRARVPFVIGFLVSVLALITLSVKRSLHDKMYPTLDEITPNRVSAGTSATLKLHGQNQRILHCGSRFRRQSESIQL